MKYLPIAAICFGLSSPVHADSWAFGVVDIVESWPNGVLVQWRGPNAENCQNSTVVFNEDTLGNAAALDRAYRASLTAAVSGKPIRFRLTGCSTRYQSADVVQLCATSNCAYSD